MPPELPRDRCREGGGPSPGADAVACRRGALAEAPPASTDGIRLACNCGPRRWTTGRADGGSPANWRRSRPVTLASSSTAPGTATVREEAASEEATYFGCRFAKGVSRQVAIRTDRGNSWIQFGTLAAGLESFRVDKKAIFATLQRQTRVEGCLFCPAFRWQRVRDEVNDLANVIELGKDSKFEVYYSHINPKTAMGVRLKESAEDAAFLQFGPGRLGRDEPPHKRNVPAVRYADVAGQDAALERSRAW